MQDNTNQIFKAITSILSAPRRIFPQKPETEKEKKSKHLGSNNHNVSRPKKAVLASKNSRRINRPKRSGGHKRAGRN